MKKVFALMGCYRKNQNTNHLLEYLLEGIRENDSEINKVYVRDMKIHQCTGCDHCGRTGECVFKDDMDIIYDGLDNSDIFIFAAPIYFNSINAISKNVIDRCQKYWSNKFILGNKGIKSKSRKGIFLSVAGGPFTQSHFNGTTPILDIFFKATNINYFGNYVVSNTDKNPVKDNILIKNELFEIGKNIDNINKFSIHR